MDGGACEATTFSMAGFQAGALCLPLKNTHNHKPGGGMGLEIALGLLKAGGSVVAIDLKPQPKSLISDRCLYAQGDLVDDAFVRDAINTGAAQFGRIDYLANVAGVLWFEKDVSLLNIDFETWDVVFDINS